jgi:hypothetical protein
MDQEYRSGQGSIIPTLFIGLGGTGSRIVDRIAGRAATLPNWESQLRPLTSFVSIDTNELDQHKLRNIPDGNRLNIAAFDKAKAIQDFRDSEDMQALQWLDPGYEPRPGIKPGAGQIRVEARLGFFYNSPKIKQRFRELVKESLRPGITWRQSSKYNVYFFCTLGGGTGSGCFLTTAYLIDAALREQKSQPRIVANLLLSTLMLEKVGPELHRDIHANTYAALKELEFLTKLDYAEDKRKTGRTSVEFVYFRDQNNRAPQHVSTRPFFISFILDRPPSLGLPDAEAAIADAAFLQIFTPIDGNMASEYDNYEKNLTGLTHFPGRLKELGEGYTKNFGAYGAAAMVLPGRELLEYSASRFAAQAIRSQITFSVDASDPSDDRARALAKLAVDYSDPKFLRMSDEGRERVIHQSFIASVQEMARQDQNEELFDGFWFGLIESIDEGRQTGVDEKGDAIRGESYTKLIERKLDESRRDLLNKVSIKDRAFVFHREGVNQYVELVSRLIDDIRAARQIVDEGVRGLETAAAEGEVVAELKLDPIAERYLAVRLAERCERTWILDAQQQLEKAKLRDISNPSVRDRLERENYEMLKAAAERRRLFRGDQDFLNARDEAQEYFRAVATAARKTLDAEVRLRQLRTLLEYLQRRSRQYARLATRMDVLVQELERDAERLRRGETILVPPLALRVEIFETLDEPRNRMWDRVYAELFVDDGRYIGTFDRQLLAATITQELKPTINSDGRIVEKSVDQTVSDLRRALLDLGRERLRPTIFGQVGQPGLDVVRGLDLEAKLVLQPAKQPGKVPTEEEIEDYGVKKFRALSQLAGVLARVNAEASNALDDGVEANRTRQLIIGLREADLAKASERFVARLKSVLSEGGYQVKADTWHDPRLIIVHDVELPIPLYYVEPIVGEIESAYLQVASDKNRAYNLHTDFQWEKALPNLNPRRSQITVEWALRTLVNGLLTRVIIREPKTRMCVWQRTNGASPEVLGTSFAGALYQLGKIDKYENLKQRLEEDLREAHRHMDVSMETTRRNELADLIRNHLAEIENRDRVGAATTEDILDRPILGALMAEMARQSDWLPKATTTEDKLYERFNFDTP